MSKPGGKRQGQGKIKDFFTKKAKSKNRSSTGDEENVHIDEAIQSDRHANVDSVADSASQQELEYPVVTTANPVASTCSSSSSSSSSSSKEVMVVASRLFVRDRDDVMSTTAPANHGLNENSPTQPRLQKFPATLSGSVTRSFNSSWYKGRKWLEYSVNKDAAYCFPCRVFGVNPSSTTFTEEGFRDWKHALDGWNVLDTVVKTPQNKKKLKGFAKHVSSAWHVNNLAAWREKERRETAGMTLESVVCKLDNDNRKWVEVIFHVIRYLAADGLPLRGN